MQDRSVLQQLEELPYLAPYIDLIKTSIRMDVFSSLTKPLTPSELAQEKGWHEGNTAYLLGALASVGFLKKEGDAFVNAEETRKYLVKGRPEYENIHSVLDAGCSAGLLGLTVIGDRADRTGVLLDQIPASLIEANIRSYGLEGRVKAVNGDLLTDSIGEGYDLILAIGVLSFVKQDLQGVLRKFFGALNPRGVLVCVSEGIERDTSGPWDMVMGYLPYYLRGMPFALLKNEVADAAKEAGFINAENETRQMTIGIQDVNIFRKPAN